ncbi:Agamous-like MADS-box protein AGL62, partial [Linum grandiflorum]
YICIIVVGKKKQRFSKMVKKSKGRQKLAMVRIANDSNRMVTFSKRRSGVFKKASELSTLCGAEVGIVVFSPGNRVFSFGNPNVENIINNFYSGTRFAHHPSSVTDQFIEAQRQARVDELNIQLTQVLEEYERFKKRGEQLDKLMIYNLNRRTLLETPVDELDQTQLFQFKSSLEMLKSGIHFQAQTRAQAFEEHHANMVHNQALAQPLFINPASMALVPDFPQVARPQYAHNPAPASNYELYQRFINESNESEPAGNENMMVNEAFGYGHVGPSA